MVERTRTSRGRIAAGVAAATVVAAALVVAGGVRATFPGNNGLIAYIQSGDVYVINPSTNVPTQITNTGNYEHGVGFNAAANQLVASTCCAGLVLLSPVAGSSVTPVPNTFVDDYYPAFDPTGTKLVFNTGTEVSPASDLVTISLNGADRTTIYTGGAQPDWSPDGTFIAFHEDDGSAIKRLAPNGGSVVTLATTGPDGVIGCGEFTPCTSATVAPDNTHVLYTQDAGGQQCQECCEGPCEFSAIGEPTGGLAEINSDGTSLAPRRITFQGPEGPHVSPSYSPDGTKVTFSRGDGGLSTAPTDGSGTSTTVGTVGIVEDTSWGIAPGTGTGTGTGAGTGTGGSVITVAATRTGGNCVFDITATPAGAGITVDFQVTNNKGVVKLTGNDVVVPVSPTVKARKHGENKLRHITLSDAKGATIGVATATCAK